MRRLYPFLFTLVIVVLLIIGFFTVEGPWRTADDPGVPQDQYPTADAPEDVDETPRSAEQNIDEP